MNLFTAQIGKIFLKKTTLKALPKKLLVDKISMNSRPGKRFYFKKLSLQKSNYLQKSMSISGLNIAIEAMVNG